MLAHRGAKVIHTQTYTHAQSGHPTAVISVHKVCQAQDSCVVLPCSFCPAVLLGLRYVWHDGAAPRSLLEPMNERMDRGKREESQGNTLIITLKERGLGEEGEGGWRQEGCCNGVFVLVGVSHKASTRAAKLSYRNQTQGIKREEHVCTNWGPIKP